MQSREVWQKLTLTNTIPLDWHASARILKSCVLPYYTKFVWEFQGTKSKVPMLFLKLVHQGTHYLSSQVQEWATIPCLSVSSIITQYSKKVRHFGCKSQNVQIYLITSERYWKDGEEISWQSLYVCCKLCLQSSSISQSSWLIPDFSFCPWYLSYIFWNLKSSQEFVDIFNCSIQRYPTENLLFFSFNLWTHNGPWSLQIQSWHEIEKMDILNPLNLGVWTSVVCQWSNISILWCTMYI